MGSLPKIDLYLGDCLDVLKTFPENSIDSIVTDSPYGLSFMGKKWDYDVPSVEVWTECLRVLKPGGHLLSFAGSRTYHRMAVRIEDAGFEIRDQIMYIYGSGFPKSHNIKKQIEKEYLCQFLETANNAENKSKLISVELIEEKTGSVLGNVVILQEEGNENKMVIGGEVGSNQMDTSTFVSTQDIEQNTTLLLKNKLEENLKDGNKSITLTELKMIIDLKIFNLFQYQNTLKSIETQNHTALKPAHEPIVMARKPLSEKSIAENVLKHGTGGINIDGSRIGMKEGDKMDIRRYNEYHDTFSSYEEGESPNGKEYIVNEPHEQGRFPANIIFDKEAGKILDEQSGIGKGQKNPRIQKGTVDYTNDSWGLTVKDGHVSPTYDDKGGASRFFYCPKASKKDRNEGLDEFEKKGNKFMATKNGTGETSKGMERFTTEPKANHHPTVKPTDLMRYLINLVTPPNGTILDPFMGSGSTGKAAIRCGLNFIGIEREQEYMDIATARINHEQNKPVQQELFIK